MVTTRRAAWTWLVVGIVLGLCRAVIALRAAQDVDFRFIWARDEGEFALMEIVAGVVALALIAIGGAGLGGGRWLVRAAAYLGGTMLLTFAAIMTGIAYYEDSACAGHDEDCYSILGGFLWGAVAVAVCLVAIAVIELARWRHRRQAR
ncbi:hypothetical protein AB0E69_19495 [Kribbella sp. NPDC026611]|uniref:hypothetical protein n=1 Tax=Kribbella sp. NPDC026611 TaxID=3154911 RepID=UPI0033CDD806